MALPIIVLSMKSLHGIVYMTIEGLSLDSAVAFGEHSWNQADRNSPGEEYEEPVGTFCKRATTMVNDIPIWQEFKDPPQKL